MRATVSLGTALRCGDKSPSKSICDFLNISTWNDLDADCLAKAGCQSVLGTQPAVSRDEYAVPETNRIRGIKVVGYQQGRASAGGAPQIQPWWNWPQWVHHLAAATDVDDFEIDRVAQLHSSSAAASSASAADSRFGVRVNSAGRPIHDNGRFMSYSEARTNGWGGMPDSPPPLPRPSTAQSGRGDGGHSNGRGHGNGRGGAASSGSGYQKPSSSHGHHDRSSGHGGSSGPAHPRAPNAWNEFQHAHVHQGLSSSQLSALYRSSVGRGSPLASASSSSGQPRNPWNSHQQACSGLGMSRAQIHSSYTPSGGGGGGGMFGSSGAGGGSSGLGWNAYQASVGGQGLSKADISAGYHSQK